MPAGSLSLSVRPLPVGRYVPLGAAPSYAALRSTTAAGTAIGVTVFFAGFGGMLYPVVRKGATERSSWRAQHATSLPLLRTSSVPFGAVDPPCMARARLHLACSALAHEPPRESGRSVTLA
jgi:hypothetical protein